MDRSGDEILKQKGLLLCIGNPLLDISATTGTEFLEKYGMKPDDAILAEEKHLPITADLESNFNVQYIPGGSGQNSARCVAWVLQQDGVVTFFGSIGRDKYGQVLEKKAREAGVDTRYMYQDNVPTGTCAVVITGHNRSLCANLSAANHLRVEHLRKEENKECIDRAKFIYMTSFLVSVSPESMLELAEHGYQTDKDVLLNLSSPFMISAFAEQMRRVMPYVDIVIGNETEAKTYSETNGLGSSDLKGIALKMCELPKKNDRRKRIVVITQGIEPVLVAQDGKVTEYNVPAIEASKIVDTNGAGDAFAGGFLSQYIQRRPMKTCIEGGIYVASVVIQHSGCTFPTKPQFKD